MALRGCRVDIAISFIEEPVIILRAVKEEGWEENEGKKLSYLESQVTIRLVPHRPVAEPIHAMIINVQN